MSDSQAIDEALIAHLRADAALIAACPDGVYYDAARPHAQRYVIVSRLTGLPGDVAAFGGRAFEEYLYLVKAVHLSTAQGDITAAAARIFALLEDVALDVPGYDWMTIHRTEYVREEEPEESDPTIRWSHRGGQFHVQFATNDEERTRP